jgi:signal transduction histidine kinase/DNA-binding NarL/FixJ family response regulator
MKNISNIILILGLFVSLTTYYFLRDADSKRIEAISKNKANDFLSSIQRKVDSHLLAISRMAERWNSSQSPSFVEWKKDAESYYRDLSGMAGIGFIQDDFRIKYSHPFKEYQGKRLDNLENRRNLFSTAKKTKNELFSGPLALINKKIGFLIVHWLKDSSKNLSDSYIVVAYSFDKFLEEFNSSINEKYFVRLVINGQAVHSSSEPMPSKSYSIYGSYKKSEWRVDLYPKKEHFRTLSSSSTYLAPVTLFFIFLLAYFFLSNRKQKGKIELFNKKLVKEVTFRKTFLSNMSHEIRTPLNGVMGMVELLYDSGPTPAQTEHLDILKESGHHLLSIVNDILDLSKIESGKLEIIPESTNIRNLTTSSLSPLKSIASQKMILLGPEIADDVPKYLMIDPVRFRQIITNLVSNAIKFTAEGEIIVRLAYSNNKLHVSVTDTGIGIPKNKIKKLFSRFTQAEIDTSRRYGGTGLGLSICKLLVHHMGGELQLESELGKGSTFFFSIDAKKSSPPKNVNDSSLCIDKNFSKRHPHNILLADDNAINRKIAKALIEKLGYQIDLAEDGREVLEAVKYKQYSIILMDMQMPIMDGIEATKRLKKIYSTHCPVIIALTANALTEHKEQCYEAGMKGFITKPFGIKNIARAILSLENQELIQEGTIDKGVELFDEQKIRSLFHGDESLLSSVIGTFEDQSCKHLAELKKSINNKDFNNFKTSCYSMKGAVSNFYSSSITATINSIEDEVERSGFDKMESIVKLLDLLERDFASLKTQLRNMFSDKGT